jgi:hypothetical protein
MVTMRQLLPSDPLDLSAGAGARLVLVGCVLAPLWVVVAWAMGAG